MRSPAQVRPSLLFFMKTLEWYKVRPYPHIGTPLTWDDKKRICSYVKNKSKISKHSFHPFIHKTIVSRKLRKIYDKNGNLLNDGKREVLKPKVRDLYYSNHLDANIFSYYAHLLSKMYEKVLKEKKLNEVVTAYRKIPLYENGSLIRNKCNIDFANEVFKFIIDNVDKNIVCITLDIKSFFDNLNHNILKDAWNYVCKTEKLDEDHYAIFKNITKFSFVEEKDLFKLFQDKIIIKTKSGIEKKKRVKRLKYLQNQNAIAFCDRNDIHTIRKKGLIRSNKHTNSNIRNVGICQGSPISSVLANIYMLEFDEHINSEVFKLEGLYRRYSDDIVIICNVEDKQELIQLINYEIINKAKLEIQEDKTRIYHIKRINDRIQCYREFNGILNENSIKWDIEYLGFSFNGQITYLKTSALGKYFRKMKLATRRCRYFSNSIRNKSNGQIFKRRLFKKFSYIGARRKSKYERVKGTTDCWRKTHKLNWGNFITYAKLASKTMINNKIESQVKNHWKILNNEIKKASR